MLYAALWRAIPGPRPLKTLTVLVLLAAVVAICFVWVFPAVDPILPFNNNTIDPGGPPAAPHTRSLERWQPGTVTQV